MSRQFSSCDYLSTLAKERSSIETVNRQYQKHGTLADRCIEVIRCQEGIGVNCKYIMSGSRIVQSIRNLRLALMSMKNIQRAITYRLSK